MSDRVSKQRRLGKMLRLRLTNKLPKSTKEKKSAGERLVTTDPLKFVEYKMFVASNGR